MKTIEEKAKAYDEAVKQLRIMMPNWENLSYNGKTFLQDLVHIIPELAESEDERIRKDIVEAVELHKDFTQVRKEHIYAWLEKQRKQILANSVKTFKDAWSEEDEMMLECVLDKIRDLGTGEMCKDWLKSLKDRVQPKVELTQLDKNILEAAIAFVEKNHHFNCWRGVDKHTVLSALHSLIPQSNWKPSDEQMGALAWALSLAKNCGEEWAFDLSTLYEQLKKLREE